MHQISPAQAKSVTRAPHGSCPTCPRPRVPGVVPPGTYVLHFYEFKDYPAARDACRFHKALAARPTQAVAKSSTIYVFRRESARTTHVATLRGGTPYGFTVKASEGPVELFAFLSHFPVPAARLAQYVSPGASGIQLLRRRAVRFTPADRVFTWPVGGPMYDVVLPDWRRIGWDLHVSEQKALNTMADWVSQPARAQRRMLMELTLATAKGYQKQDRKVWSWLKPMPLSMRTRQDAGRSRVLGLTREPPTDCELQLNHYYEHVERLQHDAELAAQAKYEWMGEDGYREMRWDALTDPAAEKDNALREATLVTPASQTHYGRAYLQSYAVTRGSWHMRYLRHLRADEQHAIRTDASAADAYWGMLAAIGTALIGNPDALGDYTQQANDTAKNAGGVIDATSKALLKPHEQEVENRLAAFERAEKHAKKAQAMKGQITAQDQAALTEAKAQLARARAALAEAEQVAKSPTWVVQSWIVESIRDAVGHAPGAAQYDPEHSRFVSTEGDYVGPVSVRMTQAEASPHVRRALESATQQAADAKRNADARTSAVDEKLERRERSAEHFEAEPKVKRGNFIAAEQFEARFAHAAWATTGMLAALQLLNLGLALKTMQADKTVENKVKTGGAVADLMYAFEYGFARAVTGAERNVAMAGAETSGPLMGRLLFGCRFLGMIGGTISTIYSVRDASTALTDHNTGLAAANGAAAVGSGMVVLAAGGAIGEGLGLTGVAIGVVTSGPFMVVAAVIAVAAAIAIWYFTDAPVKAWLRHCPWGIDGDPNAAIPGQLQSLLQMLCTPGMSAQNVTNGRPGVIVTLRPPMFFAGQSKMTVDLTVTHKGFNNYGGHEAIVPFEYQVAETPRSVVLGPIDARVMARLEAGPVDVPVGGPGPSSGVRVRAYRDEKGIAFDVFVPVSRRLEARHSYGEVSGYVTEGSARLELWSATDKAWSQIKLQPFKLSETDVVGAN